MAYNELLQSMELGAQEKIKEIIGAARMAADDIFRDAKRESEEVKRQLQAEAADAVSVERNRSLYLLQEELKAEEIREKERIYLEAFEKAGEELKSYREDPRYRESFTRILRESLDGIQAKDIEVHIDPRDAELCFQALKAQESKFQLVTDLHSIGGHIIRIPDGSITIDNTIESRILQAREVLKKEIYSILFG